MSTGEGIEFISQKCRGHGTLGKRDHCFQKTTSARDFTLDIPDDVLTNREVRVSLYKNGIGFKRK